MQADHWEGSYKMKQVKQKWKMRGKPGGQACRPDAQSTTETQSQKDSPLKHLHRLLILQCWKLKVTRELNCWKKWCSELLENSNKQMKEGRESIQDLYNKIIKGYDVINKTDPKLKKKLEKYSTWKKIKQNLQMEQLILEN